MHASLGRGYPGDLRVPLTGVPGRGAPAYAAPLPFPLRASLPHPRPPTPGPAGAPAWPGAPTPASRPTLTPVSLERAGCGLGVRVGPARILADTLSCTETSAGPLKGTALRFRLGVGGGGGRGAVAERTGESLLNYPRVKGSCLPSSEMKQPFSDFLKT